MKRIFSYIMVLFLATVTMFVAVTPAQAATAIEGWNGNPAIEGYRPGSDRLEVEVLQFGSGKISFRTRFVYDQIVNPDPQVTFSITGDCLRNGDTVDPRGSINGNFSKNDTSGASGYTVIDGLYYGPWQTTNWVCWNTTDPVYDIVLRRNGVIVSGYYSASNPNAPIAPVGPDEIAAGNCTLSDTQLVQVIRSSGFAEADLPTALAVLLQESGGKVNAYNENTDGSRDYGLYQINDKAHPTYDPVLLGTNPSYNTDAAFDIFTTAGGWSPWVAYSSGAYQKQMERAQTAVTAAPTTALALSDCSGGIAPGDNSGDVDNGSDCTGWNPLTYVKCALRWAFVPPDGAMQQWNDQIDGITSKPPINWIVTGFSFCNAFIDGIGSDVPESLDRSVTTMHVTDDLDLDFFAGARQATQNNTAFNYFYAAQTIAIWGGAGWMMLNMVNRRFGGKE